jgi:hypothetical protein
MKVIDFVGKGSKEWVSSPVYQSGREVDRKSKSLRRRIQKYQKEARQLHLHLHLEKHGYLPLVHSCHLV